MLENQEIQNEIEEKKEVKHLFTRSRILFLIVVFLVMLMPLIYRNFDYLLK